MRKTPNVDSDLHTPELSSHIQVVIHTYLAHRVQHYQMVALLGIQGTAHRLLSLGLHILD